MESVLSDCLLSLLLQPTPGQEITTEEKIESEIEHNIWSQVNVSLFTAQTSGACEWEGLVESSSSEKMY